MIALQNISIQYGEKVLFKDINVTIGARDRIGLTGPNGAGKSTLLKVINGTEAVDAGNVAAAHHASIGYLPQDGIVLTGKTLFEEVESAFEAVLSLQSKIDATAKEIESLAPDDATYLEALDLIGGWEHQLEEVEAHKLPSKIEKILLGLGFAMEDMERDCAEFSGGWQMRIALAKLLLRQPSLLLLDEPTNHLDLDSLRWVEAYLNQYEGAILLVSHDRAFLDGLTNRTFALRHARLEDYRGNYSYFEKERKIREENLQQAFKNQQKQIDHTERFIERFRSKATKATQVQSRIKALDKIDRIELEEEEDTIQFTFPSPPRSGQVVMELAGVCKRYGDLDVLSNIEFRIERGERIAIVGVNGAGKSTMVKILAGVEPFHAGERRIGHNTTIAYFAQHQADTLDPKQDVLTTVEDVLPPNSGRNPRSVLGAFLFKGDDVFKQVGVLSGGEKNRLALAKMLLQPFNCLILDEPTNHLDMQSKDILQHALQQYPGSFVIVSHDRDFLDPIVTKVVEVSKSGLRTFVGNVSDYIAKIDAERAVADASAAAGKVNMDSAHDSQKLSSKERRKLVAERNKKLGPLKKEAAALEDQIAEMEAEHATLETAMADPDFFKQGTTTKASVDRYDELKAKIQAAYERWEMVTEKIAGCTD